MKPASPSTGFAVCIGGIPGVGKTTLLQKHVAINESRDRAITGSAVLRKVIAPASFEDFDRWPFERKVVARDEAVQRLVIERKECLGRLLVDGHFTLRNRLTGKVEPVFTTADRRFYNALALVEGTVEEVLDWRRKDPRDRGSESYWEVREHLLAEREEGSRLSREMGVPYLIVLADDQRLGMEMLDQFLDQHVPLGGRP